MNSEQKILHEHLPQRVREITVEIYVSVVVELEGDKTGGGEGQTGTHVISSSLAEYSCKIIYIENCTLRKACFL